MQATKQQFLDMMTQLRLCYSNAIAERHWEGMVRAYWKALGDYSLERLRCIFAHALKRHPDWFPSCGQLLQLLEGDPATRAEQAWPELCRLATRSSGEHSDPIAREAIALLGGGAALGRMTSADMHGWWRRRFVETYARVARDTAAIGPSCPQEGRALPPGSRPRGGCENAAEDHGDGRTENPSGVDTYAGSPMHEYTERSKTWWQ